jgi:transposase
MARKTTKRNGQTRRVFTQEFKQDAVQMLLDGHSTSSVADRLGVGMNLLYRWKSQLIEDSGPTASALESRVRELEADLRRVERERDILKKALAIFGRTE